MAEAATTTPPNHVTNVKIDFLDGSGNTFYATWDWHRHSDTDKYEVVWEWYNTKEKKWLPGTTADVSVDGKTQRYSEYSPPDNEYASKIRIKIKPVAVEDEVKDGKNTVKKKRFSASWSTYVTHEIGGGKVKSKGGVKDLNISIQKGSTRTMVAKWEWGAEHTDHYEVQWSYYTGDGIRYDGDKNDETRKLSTYDAPDNATKVMVAVKPISTTRSVNGKEASYWTSKKKSVTYKLKAGTIPERPAIQASDITIREQTGADRTLYATWKWNDPSTGKTYNNVAGYTLEWSYDTGDGLPFPGEESTAAIPPVTYSAPENALTVHLRIIPNALTHTVNGVENVAYWTSDWSETVSYTFSQTPEVPSTPTVTIEQFTLTAEVSYYDTKAAKIAFEIVDANNPSAPVIPGEASVLYGTATFVTQISGGGNYKARARAIGADGSASEWSEYSEKAGTIPATPSGFASIYAQSSTQVRLTWNAVADVDTYEIEYAEKEYYFDASGDVQSATVDGKFQNAVINGLETGKRWFFRLRATNEAGSSGWGAISSLVLGTKPAAPTTWSLTSTGIVGEDIILYWVHNSEDGSKQRAAQLEISVNGAKLPDVFIDTSAKAETDEANGSDKEATNSYILSTKDPKFTEGAKVLWRVKTKGVTDEFSDWSTERTINVYAPPTLVFNGQGEHQWYWDTFCFPTDTIYTAYGSGGRLKDVLTSFPYYIYATAGPKTQKPVGYYLTISSTETYETVNDIGEVIWVNAGQEIYSKYIDGNPNRNLFVALTASDIDLENNISYLLHCSVYMDSGLTAEASATFRVAWSDDQYIPNAEIAINSENLSAYIRPYCAYASGELVEDVLLSVYRREYDGGFKEIAKNLENQRTTVTPLLDAFGNYIFDANGGEIQGREINPRAVFVVDPHPSLDYARYRIVATSRKTGSVGYYDLPGNPVGEIAAILQWNEKWVPFDVRDGAIDEKPWSGTMLKLPYNLDVSDSGATETSLINYIGRENPVSYYGTQKQVKSTWSTQVVKDDKETLYLLRKLQRYAGDVYVREPSGSGYWANVVVSFSQTHNELTIPVTLDITKVEGGV